MKKQLFAFAVAAGFSCSVLAAPLVLTVKSPNGSYNVTQVQDLVADTSQCHTGDITGIAHCMELEVAELMGGFDEMPFGNTASNGIPEEEFYLGNYFSLWD